MRYQLFSIFVALIIVVSSAHADQTPTVKLKFDNELISDSAIEAYGRATVNRNEYCPPTSDPYVLNQFIKQALVARQSEIAELANNEIVLANTLRPIQENIIKVKQYLKNANNQPSIKNVYKRQISRLELELELNRQQANASRERSARYRSGLSDRVKQLKDVSDSDKIYLSKLGVFSSLYSKNLREKISEEAILNRYNDMLEEKNQNLVNVHFFEYRTAFVTTNDKHTISNVSDYLKGKSEYQGYTVKGIGSRSANTTYRYPTNMVITAHSLSNHTSWSRLESIWPSAEKDPDSIEAGSTLVSDVIKHFRSNNDMYQVTHILNKSFFPIVELHEKTPDRRIAASFIENELFAKQYEASIAALLADSQITVDGELYIEPKDYASCPTK